MLMMDSVTRVAMAQREVGLAVGEPPAPREIQDAGRNLRKLMAAHKEKEDLIAIGAYQPGADPIVDEALAKRGAIEGYLQQRVDEPSTIADADAGLMALAAAPVPPEEAAAILDELAPVAVAPAPAAPAGPVAL